MPEDAILKLYDASGNFLGIFVPASCGEEIKKLEEKPVKPEIEDDLAGFNELMENWTFSYPYDPSVVCPACGSECADWQHDPQRLFRLASANFGGLLVFHCKNCGATIRHKYFKKHVAKEVSV